MVSFGWPRYYRTLKKVKIDDRRLAALKWFLFIGIAVFVGIIELWMWGGALSPAAVSGAVTFDVDHPTLPPGCNVHSTIGVNDTSCVSNFSPLTDLPYCEQYTGTSESQASSYPGPILPCTYLDATDANIVTDNSVSVISSATTSTESRICNELSGTDVQCQNIYNTTSVRGPFYVAQAEDFIIDISHVVSSTTQCQNRYDDYRCSSPSNVFQGRLYSTSSSQCSTFVAYSGPRGSQTTTAAPCYLATNTTDDGADQFSISFLLEAAGASLDDCDPRAEQRDDLITEECTTYRLDGITVQLSVGWNNFERYVGLVQPFYAYYPIVLSGAGFQQYRTTPMVSSSSSDALSFERIVEDAYGTRIIVTLGGSFSSFSFLPFLITLFTAFGMMKIGKLILDKVMVCLPEGKYYRLAKFDKLRIDLDENGNLIEDTKDPESVQDGDVSDHKTVEALKSTKEK